MNPTVDDMYAIRKLVEGVAQSRTYIEKGKILWAWKRLSSLQRRIDHEATRAEYLDHDHLGEVLDVRSAIGNAKRR